MFNKIIFLSLKYRISVLFLAIIVTVAGIWSLSTMKVDILPDINKPTVTIFAEAEGLAAEEVERLILTPIEASILGIPGLERVRGTASFGLAIINIEFNWNSDIYRNRQIIQERLVISQLPEGVVPVLGPVGSIMGEIMWVGITSDDDEVDPMQLRTLADWTIRPALLRIPGVSEVLVMGGDVREWQININAEQMKRYNMHLEDVEMSIKNALSNKSGGILVQGNKEFPIRIMMAPTDVAQLKDVSIGNKDGKPVRLADLAIVEEGVNPSIQGTASINGQPGAILRIIRQPDAETLKVTESIDKTLNSLSTSLPDGVKLYNDLFRQEWFIHAGLENVLEALRDGAILVVIILILFLMNFRTTAITFNFYYSYYF
jgi:Cu/Ag efflux pump CusA